MNFQEFKKIYLQKVDQVYEHFDEKLQTSIAKHCYAWHPREFNFYNYLKLSATRYFYFYENFLKNSSIPKEKIHLLDIGGFFCVFPLTLRELGYQVSISEKLEYYDDGFLKIFDLAKKSGIKIHDVELVEAPNKIGQFTHITCLALIEHLPNSPEILLKNIHQNLAPQGEAFIEVPNIAYWPKRWNLFRHGQTPLPHIKYIFKSATPFIGHHHEYTIEELRWLLTETNFKIEKEFFFNYSLPTRFDIRQKICRINWPIYLFDNCKEILAVKAKKA